MPIRRSTVLMLATASLLGACTSLQSPKQVKQTLLWERDNRGVVIASSGFEEGTTIATTVAGTPDDCEGPGFGVTTSSSRGDTRLLLDADGEPCNPAKLLFDGRQGLYQRAADPGIKINIHSPYGPAQGFGMDTATGFPTHPGDKTAETLAALPVVRVKAEPLGASAKDMAAADIAMADVAPAAGPMPVQQAQPEPRQDRLASLLQTWQQPSGYAASVAPATDDASSAAARALTNSVEKQRASALQEQTAKLLAELREKERLLQAEQRRHAATREVALQQKSATAAALSSWQQQQEQTNSQLAATQQRLQAFEALNQRLAQEKQQKDKLYTERLQTIEQDLKAAESQASRSRNELVMAAAQKIAEAEQLANAARMAEADAKAREAARMKQEAEDMLSRALDLKNNQAVILANSISPTQVAPVALLEAPVVVHMKDRTLPDILTEILKQAEPQSGKWTPDWQLPAASRTLLEDKWSLTAEAPVQALLQNLTAQVQSARSIKLKFTQFPQSRLVVVTQEEGK